MLANKPMDIIKLKWTWLISLDIIAPIGSLNTHLPAMRYLKKEYPDVQKDNTTKKSNHKWNSFLEIFIGEKDMGEY